jgi:hypothetical protein
MYIVASVAIVLAESRIDRAFQWFLFPYICHIFTRPFRISAPTILVVLAAFLLNMIGWSKPAKWDVEDWFSMSFTGVAWLSLVLHRPDGRHQRSTRMVDSRVAGGETRT